MVFAKNVFHDIPGVSQMSGGPVSASGAIRMKGLKHLFKQQDVLGNNPG